MLTQAEIVALLERCAAGRREYAKGSPPEMEEHLLHEASVFDQAARIAAGDIHSLCGALPSWRWTDEEETRATGEQAPSQVEE